MKNIIIKVNYVEDGQEEIIVNIKKEHSDIVRQLNNIIDKKRIVGVNKDEKMLIEWSDVMYFEYVDGLVFAYLKDKECTVSMSLGKIEQESLSYGFFRCSKSMIVNINYIDHFQSTFGNRIIATLSNKEEIIISRCYAKQLRARLKED